MQRVSSGTIHQELFRVLQKLGFSEDRADLCARLFTESSRDGVSSHGLNRFPRFCAMIQNGSIDVDAEPVCISRLGALEQWDGRLGPGNLNAWFSMRRALELARENGVGMVGLRNTNHWMRGGTYGWQAADAGMIGICWTNTMQNMPAWGSDEPRLGNGPLVVAVPRSSGHVVLDMSTSQFSYGTISDQRIRGESLPVPGGFDVEGNLTTDPGAIEASLRPLPVGYWKGSALSLVLDMAAAILSGGRASHQISRDPMKEIGLSQVFLAFDPEQLQNPFDADRLADDLIDHLHGSHVEPTGERVRYPGERTLATRRESEVRGIPVDDSVWAEIQAM
jgi:3-dehydro-L-gulonate 2-dehydrogenase